jgi:citrate synthase
MTKVHEGPAAGRAARAATWSTSITATTDRHVYVRGVALDEAIGRESFPAMLLRLWRADSPSESEADLMGACLVAAIDHGPLAPSALVARTIASMRILTTVPAEGDLEAWADATFTAERDAGRRLPGIGHRWHTDDLRAERLLEVAAALSDGRHPAAVRALAARVGRHVGHPVAVNIDGALAVALTALRLDPEYGDFLFAIARSFGLAAHVVEERARERPMRLIDPTAALYDGVPVPDSLDQETDR